MKSICTRTIALVLAADLGLGPAAGDPEELGHDI